MAKIILIAAMAQNRVIGRGSKIPWHIPEEQQRFKAITMGHTLIMGRKTFEAIGRPLPGRKTVVITRQKGYEAPGCLVAESLPAALSLCAADEKIFIAGGGQIYQEALPLADEIHLSILMREVDGDIFFPEFDRSLFDLVSTEQVSGPDPYAFTLFRRKG